MSLLDDACACADFDSWMQLAVRDPKAFEQERKACIDAYISDVSIKSHRQRLECLQWKIERQRDLSANPIDSCVRLNGMMWDTFAGERGLTTVINEIVNKQSIKLPSAEVVAFKSRN